MAITFVVYYTFFTYNRKNIKFYSNQQFRRQTNLLITPKHERN